MIRVLLQSQGHEKKTITTLKSHFCHEGNCNRRFFLEYYCLITTNNSFEKLVMQVAMHS